MDERDRRPSFTAVASALIAKLSSQGKAAEYSGFGTCYIEFGGGRIGKVEVTFLASGRDAANRNNSYRSAIQTSGVDFFSGPTPTGTYYEPSIGLRADKNNFGASRCAMDTLSGFVGCTLGEHTGFGRFGIGAVTHHVDTGIFGFQGPRLDWNPAILGHSAFQHYSGNAMLWHAQEQIVGHFRIVSEHRNLASAIERRHAAARNELIPRSVKAATSAREVSGEGGTGLPNGSTKLISQASRRCQECTLQVIMRIEHVVDDAEQLNAWRQLIIRGVQVQHAVTRHLRALVGVVVNKVLATTA
jgi:hypothetical protein